MKNAQKKALVQENNRPPSHRSAPPSRQASGGLSLSLSLSFSRTILLGEGPQVVEKMVAFNPPGKKVRVPRTPLVVLKALGGM